MESNPISKRTDEEGQQLAQQMDDFDESQIAEEMKGKVINEYFYEFKEAGTTKVGLSFAGVKYMAGIFREQGHALSIEHTNIELSPAGDSWLGNAICKDLATGEKRGGHFEQPRERNGKPNPFAYTLAGSKAERNAMRHFMPESAIVKAKEEWEKLSGKKATKDITGDVKVSDPSQKPVPCRTCGKDIIFVTVGSKRVPKNPDGSQHDDPK